MRHRSAYLLFIIVMAVHSTRRISTLYRRMKFRYPKSLMMSDSGHQGTVSEISKEQEVILNNLKAYQDKIPRLSMAEEVRTLIDNSIM